MHSVMVVDDDVCVLRVMALTLRMGGFEPDTYDQPADALRAFSRNPQMYHLLVTDIMMPGLLGTELAYQVLEIRPNLPVIFVTGYAHGAELPQGDLLSRYPVLSKPAQISLLRVTASTLLRPR